MDLMEPSDYQPITDSARLSIAPPARSGVFVLPLHGSLLSQQHQQRLPLRQRRCDDNELVANDEALADLQPENSDDEEDSGDRPRVLSQEQQKVEYMAALGLVPPAVLEEIHRRQEVLRAEYGNWWDRLHSTDFCLVPKTENGIINELQVEQVAYPMEYLGVTSGDGVPAQQVAAGPDEGALVEQITYLTSWPQTTPTAPAPSGGVEASTVGSMGVMEDSLEDQRGELVQSLKYMQQLAAMKQLPVDEQQFQATLQHLVSVLNLPPSNVLPN